MGSRKVRAGEKWIFPIITNTAATRPLRWAGSFTSPPQVSVKSIEAFKSVVLKLKHHHTASQKPSGT